MPWGLTLQICLTTAPYHSAADAGGLQRHFSWKERLLVESKNLSYVKEIYDMKVLTFNVIFKYKLQALKLNLLFYKLNLKGHLILLAKIPHTQDNHSA